MDEYTTSGYQAMARDGFRMEPYANALEAAIQPGDRVLDIGCGTGVMTLLACRFGAGRVVAIEPSSSVHQALANVRGNGFEDCVDVYRGYSDQLMVEPFDVIVSDLRGITPLHTSHLETICDARQRLLKEHGRLIPRRDELYVALAKTTPKESEWHPSKHDLSLQYADRRAHQQPKGVRLSPESLLTPAARWSELDYQVAVAGPVSGNVILTAESAGTALGVVVWFDTQLFAEHGFSNAPSVEGPLYGQVLLPLETRTEVELGDEISLELRAQPVDGQYHWSWKTHIARGTSVVRETQQSELFSSLSRSPRTGFDWQGHRPGLSARGHRILEALRAFEAGRSLGEISRAQRLESGSDLDSVQLLSYAEKYGREARLPLLKL